MQDIENNNDEIIEPWYKGPIKYIIMTFLLLLIIWLILCNNLQINIKSLNSSV